MTFCFRGVGIIELNELLSPKENSGLIYHYTTAAKAIESILYERKILFTSLYRTNDPLEFENYQHGVTSYGSAKEEVWRLFKTGDEINHAIKSTCKVSCYSMDNPQESRDSMTIYHKGYCRSRMWSQYADNHRGICLVFNRQKILDTVAQKPEAFALPTSASFKLFNGRVKYENDLSKLHAALILNLNTDRGLSVDEFIQKNYESYLFCKLLDYRDEQEYRICLYSDSFKEKDVCEVDYLDALEAIILGCKFPKAYWTNTDHYQKKLGVPAFYMQWLNGVPVIIHASPDRFWL